MKRLLLISSLALSVATFGSCKNDNKNNKNTQNDTLEVKQDLNKTFYLVPSPEDIFGFVDEKSLIFHPELLNPESNLNIYNDVKSQEFNFGVYAADLAYCAANNKNDETTNYLNIVRKLSQNIGLSDVFNESLVNRIEHISPVKDSLISISNDTYFDVLRYLEKNNRDVTLSLLACGGWIESMYLVINQTKYDKKSSLIQKIADQKYIATNLWKLLEQNQSDPNVKAIMDEFANINKTFESLEVKINEENSKIKTEDDKVIVVGGNLKVEMSEQQFNNLKNYINTTRNKLTQNNVSN